MYQNGNAFYGLLYNVGHITVINMIDLWIFMNWLYAQLHYFLNFSQLVSCLTLLAKLIPCANNFSVYDECFSESAERGKSVMA